MALIAAHLNAGVIMLVTVFPHLHIPFPSFSSSLLSLVVSVEIKIAPCLLNLFNELCVNEIQTEKGSNERLFILTRTHGMQIFGEIPFVKPQNDT